MALPYPEVSNYEKRPLLIVIAMSIVHHCADQHCNIVRIEYSEHTSN